MKGCLCLRVPPKLLSVARALRQKRAEAVCVGELAAIREEVLVVTFTMHRIERGEGIAIATAFLYAKDGGVWRLAQRAEGDVLQIHAEMTYNGVPFECGMNIPAADYEKIAKL